MRTKKAYCPTCSCGHLHPKWDATLSCVVTDDATTLVPTWECRCCHRVEPRIVRAKRRNGPNFLLDMVDGGE